VVVIRLDVWGLPQPQGNKTGYLGTDGRVKMVEGRRGPARKLFREWRGEVIAAAAREAGTDPAIDEPCAITLQFFMPELVSDPYRTRHRADPDLDKLVRAVFDSLVLGGLVRDDSRFCDLVASKRHARNGATGVIIEIEPLGDLELADRDALKAAAREARSRR
jgi:Holliday junction resolvase RusA-like endonuclease